MYLCQTIQGAVDVVDRLAVALCPRKPALVSYWLGHADINTTHIYIELDMDMKRKMLDQAPPPRVKKTPKWHKPGILEWLSNLAKGPALCAAPA